MKSNCFQINKCIGIGCNFVISQQIKNFCSAEVFIIFLSHYCFYSIQRFSSMPALSSFPWLCHIILCDVTGLANLHKRNIAPSVLFSTLTEFIALYNLSFFTFFLIFYVDVGSSNLSLYRMSCITPHTPGKNMRALQCGCMSVSFIFSNALLRRLCAGCVIVHGCTACLFKSC